MIDTDDTYLELIENGDFFEASSYRIGLCGDDADLLSLFQKVWQFKDRENWSQIDHYMGREFLCDWLEFKASLGELTDRTLVFRSDTDTDLDSKDTSPDPIIRDKVQAFFTEHRLCDLYDILYLCTHRSQEFGPDIKGLLSTFFDYCDGRHIDYVLATQYEPDLTDNEVRDMYHRSCDILGVKESK
ncbi:MAG: hypothetical protein LIO56_03685 [Lachnospiraceae bacterium]|nr:hypothetical protein [Lachnospiraceae bacterium]